MEIWKTIINHEDYEVSNNGNIRNKHNKELIIGDINTSGYRRVIFYYGNKKRYFVHRLVALHFCDGFLDNLIVNHIDGNKLNNKASNLEWVTRSENDKHAFNNNLRKANNCTKVAKLNLQTGEIIEAYNSISEAKENNKKASNISAVCSGKGKSSGSFGWKYI